MGGEEWEVVSRGGGVWGKSWGLCVVCGGGFERRKPRCNRESFFSSESLSLHIPHENRGKALIRKLKGRGGMRGRARQASKKRQKTWVFVGS